jgi:hypothetical protein
MIILPTPETSPGMCNIRVSSLFFSFFSFRRKIPNMQSHFACFSNPKLTFLRTAHAPMTRVTASVASWICVKSSPTNVLQCRSVLPAGSAVLLRCWQKILVKRSEFRFISLCDAYLARSWIRFVIEKFNFIPFKITASRAFRVWASPELTSLITPIFGDGAEHSNLITLTWSYAVILAYVGISQQIQPLYKRLTLAEVVTALAVRLLAEFSSTASHWKKLHPWFCPQVQNGRPLLTLSFVTNDFSAATPHEHLRVWSQTEDLAAARFVGALPTRESFKPM